MFSCANWLSYWPLPSCYRPNTPQGWVWRACNGVTWAQLSQFQAHNRVRWLKPHIDWFDNSGTLILERLATLIISGWKVYQELCTTDSRFRRMAFNSLLFDKIFYKNRSKILDFIPPPYRMSVFGRDPLPSLFDNFSNTPRVSNIWKVLVCDKL